MRIERVAEGASNQTGVRWADNILLTALITFLQFKKIRTGSAFSAMFCIKFTRTHVMRGRI